MSTNSPNQPNLPNRPQRPPQPNNYKPITFADLQKPSSPSAFPSQDFFAGFSNPVPRWAVVPFVGGVCFFSQRTVVAPLMIMILLGCLLWRLEDQARRIAGVPLSLSAIKLAFQMMGETAYAFWTPGAANTMDDGCFFWLPVFFSVCLVFIPKRGSVTLKIVLVGSCVLLASGLLPGKGFVAIFYMLDYMLFVAIIVGVFVDMNSQLTGRTQTHPANAQ